MTELQKAAMTYCKMGLAIFPIQVRGKQPLTPHGVKDASADPAIVQGWWDRWPEANIGLATGTINNLIAFDLDVDDEKGISGYHVLKEWERDNGKFPDSWLSITGRGGYHMIYRTTEKWKNSVGILPRIDIRSEGGYIVVPPSVHPNGNKYQWEDSPEDTPLLDMADICKYFIRSNDNKDHQEAKHFVVPGKISEGRRNDTMFRLACSLQAKGLSDDAIFAACLRENESKFDPPIEEDELKTIVNSCITRFSKGGSIYWDAKGEAHEAKKEPNIEKDDKGRVMQTIANAAEAIQFDPALYGKIWLNEMAYSPFVRGSLPWDLNESNYREWNNYDDSALRSYVEQKYGIKPKPIDDAFNVVIAQNRYNPLIDWLESCHNKWNHKTGYIRKLLPYYLGVEDSEYTYEVMKIFMLGAISRAFKPGCKFDYMIVLVGSQGCGKSTFLRYLAQNNSWFDDNFNTIDGKEAVEKLRGMWIVELAELLATKRTKDVEAIKAFITSTSDNYRTPYSRRTEQRPRTCVFAATTNNELFLTDQTGNRRFLPIRCTKQEDFGTIFDHEEEFIEDVSMAWGEAMEIYKKSNGEISLKLPREIEQIAANMQGLHTEEDGRAEEIQHWLNMNKHIDRTCSTMICKEALGMETKEITKPICASINQIMRNYIVGWENVGKQRISGYGVVMCYKRTNDFVELSDDEEPEELPFD